MAEITTSTTESIAEKGPLAGLVAVVTGASKGIGKSIALHLAQSGCDLAVCSRGETALKQLEEEIVAIGRKCVAQKCDVRSEQQLSEFLQSVSDKLGKVDVLVNNAGLYKTEPVRTHSTEVWNEIIETNLTSCMIASRQVLPAMIERHWGRIINISSVSGKTGEIWGSAYSASKFGLIGFTQSLALEVAVHGITVNAICPGWVKTEMATQQLEDPQWCKLNETTPERAVEEACFSVPQMRFIEPKEIADLVAFLITESARGITGQAINVCGGLSLH